MAIQNAKEGLRDVSKPKSERALIKNEATKLAELAYEMFMHRKHEGDKITKGQNNAIQTTKD